MTIGLLSLSTWSVENKCASLRVAYETCLMRSRYSGAMHIGAAHDLVLKLQTLLGNRTEEQNADYFLFALSP